MKQFYYALALTFIFLLFCPSLSLADSKNLYLSVGDEETVTLPYDFTSHNGTGNWSNRDPSAIEISESMYSVKIKVLKWVYHRCLVEYDYYYTEDGFGRHITFSIFIDIRKPDLYLSVSPSGGTVKKGQKVELSCNNYDAKIYYTLNGSNPSTSSSEYSKYNGIEINESCTLKAVAVWGGAESEMVSARYTVEEENKTGLTVSASPSGGTVSKGTMVYLSASEYDVDIYYTLDGSNPSKSSYYYSSGITINETCTLKAIAYKNGYEPSSVLTEYYYVDSAPDPTPDPTPDPDPSPNPDSAPIPDGAIEINATNFPDENFRACLLQRNYGKDGIITVEELDKITMLELWSGDENIKSLKGIEKFTKLNWLRFGYGENSLESLDVSKNLELEVLALTCCDLPSIDVSSNTNLKYLCTYGNPITSLDVSNNPNLEKLEIRDAHLTSIDVSNNPNLEKLEIGDAHLTSIDVSNNKRLKSLSVYGNNISSIDVSVNTELEELSISSNQITSLDLSWNTKLKKLRVDENPLSTINITKNTGLTTFTCYNANITSLDISNNTLLEVLDCPYNQLTTLDISKQTKLKNLDCQGNRLTSLDVSKNTYLQTLSCFSNQLTSLDVSSNPDIYWLRCSNNRLRLLDVSKNKSLECLEVDHNNIEGSAMDDLISSLPRVGSPTIMGGNECKFVVVGDYDECNVCTTIQVAAIKEKGWVPYNSSTYKEYAGSDPMCINGILMDVDKDAPVFDLMGRRLSHTQKGINIIGGKKVMVK